MSHVPKNIIVPETMNTPIINISNNINPGSLVQSNANEKKCNPKSTQAKNKPKKNIFKKEDLNTPVKNYSQEEIIHYMHLIFLNNSYYFPKMQKYLMTKFNLNKIMKNLGIIPNEIEPSVLEIIIKKICVKSNLIQYEDFMNILLQICERIFPKEFKQDKALVTNFFCHKIFMTYNNIIFDNSLPLKDLLQYPYSSLVALLNIIPDDSQILVLNSLLYTLNEIYENFFLYIIEDDYSTKNKKDTRNIINDEYFLFENGNLNNFLNFCRDFEICPFILSETQIVTYYNLVVDNNELFKFIDNPDESKDGNKGYFTFNNFILFFVHLANYNYAKTYASVFGEEKNETNLSKLIMLLTRLECSQGMKNLVGNSLPNLSLLPNRDLFTKYNFDYQQKNEINNDNNNFKLNDDISHLINSNNINNNVNNYNIININEEEEKINNGNNDNIIDDKN